MLLPEQVEPVKLSWTYRALWGTSAGTREFKFARNDSLLQSQDSGCDNNVGIGGFLNRAPREWTNVMYARDEIYNVLF